MADSYDRYEHEGGGFMMGLLTGTVLGAGLGMLLAPKAGSELRGQLGEQARHLGSRASEGYRKASETATGWAERGRDMVSQAREGRPGEESMGGATGSSYPGTSGSSFGAGSTGSSSFGSGTTGSTSGTGGTGSTGGSDFGRS
jgi:hypothetical protein